MDSKNYNDLNHILQTVFLKGTYGKCSQINFLNSLTENNIINYLGFFFNLIEADEYFIEILHYETSLIIKKYKIFEYMINNNV